MSTTGRRYGRVTEQFRAGVARVEFQCGVVVQDRPDVATLSQVRQTAAIKQAVRVGSQPLGPVTVGYRRIEIGAGEGPCTTALCMGVTGMRVSLVTTEPSRVLGNGLSKPFGFREANSDCVLPA